MTSDVQEMTNILRNMMKAKELFAKAERVY